MGSRKLRNEILYFKTADPIHLNYNEATIYTDCRLFDHKLMNKSYVWHQVFIKHNGKVSYNDGKKLILDAILDVVGNEEFFPVRYTSTDLEDWFLVRKCPKAMDRLFSSNLRIRLSNGMQFTLKVALNVANYNFGQIAPKTKMAQAVNRLCRDLLTFKNEKGLLNLSNFGGNPEFEDIEISLRNRFVLENLCEMIYKNDEHFRHINGVLLSHNEIKSVAPLQIFHSSEFTVLDLGFNYLDSVESLCRELKNVKAKKLVLNGNPIIDNINFPGGLRAIAKNFTFIDDIPVESLAKDYTPVSQVSGSTQSGGYRIDFRNKVDVYKFERSTDWHGIRIPDANHEFTKSEIFDYFFITVSDEFEPLYPCYYTFVSGEHQFLLRESFSNIVHLVEVCNMEIKIPKVDMGAAEHAQTDVVPVQYERAIKYYFLMNLSQFKNGEIDPSECIEKALSRRYNAMDRLLDMDNFQNTPGLEKVIINLTSQKVLQSVMSIAARKFLSSCIEIRLSNNKILGVNFSKAMNLMSNVKAIDLGNNWIYELNNIKSLQVIKLKALRLDGNPLCSQFAFAADYIKAVKELFPNIHKLDNVEINVKGNFSSQKNYLCDVKAFDFVEQFVPCYFKTFQSTDRDNLKNLYHKKAMFTFVSKYKPSHPTPENTRRKEKYERLSNNLLNLQDVSLASDNVHYGPHGVMEALKALPNMLFDLLSFTVDVPIFNDNMVIICVTGVLSDQASSIEEADITLGFSRTFILVPFERNLGILKCATDFRIKHDLFSVYNPSEAQLRNSFKYSKNDEANEQEEASTNDKEDLLVIFQEMTGLKSIWCTRCLSDANWNFEKAMDVFAYLCDKKEIPDTAFV